MRSGKISSKLGAYYLRTIVIWGLVSFVLFTTGYIAMFFITGGDNVFFTETLRDFLISQIIAWPILILVFKFTFSLANVHVQDDVVYINEKRFSICCISDVWEIHVFSLTICKIKLKDEVCYFIPVGFWANSWSKYTKTLKNKALIELKSKVDSVTHMT